MSATSFYSCDYIEFVGSEHLMYCHDLRIYYERRLSKGHYLSPLQLSFTRKFLFILGRYSIRLVYL